MGAQENRWEGVLRAAARLQRIVPDAVLVGGSAARLHASHRISFDDDHFVADLGERFDAVLDDLEDSEGWITSRVKPPVLILGSLDGIETGVRQLIRQRPLEVETVETEGGPIRVPTLSECLRLKAWMVLIRNATRDYLDVVALADRVGQSAASILLAMDAYYADQQGTEGRRIAAQLARQLAQPQPYDLSDVDLEHYRDLDPHWRDWTAVADACRDLATAMLERLAHEEP